MVINRAHIPFDIEGFHYPLIAYVAQCARRGVAPLWDAYSYGGTPIHADLQAQLFYPFTWIAILLGDWSDGRNLFYWVEWLVPLHMILAGIFTFALLRKFGLARPAAFMGASIYQLGGFFASQPQHLCGVCAAAWLPLGVLAVFELRCNFRARWFGVLALAVALSILSGMAAATIVVAIAIWMFIAALVVLRQTSWRIFWIVTAAFAVGVAITAVELVPLWTLSNLSVASERWRWREFGGGLPLPSLVSFILPYHYHIFEMGKLYTLPYNSTLLYIYCGEVTAISVAVAGFLPSARARIFLALTLISAVWMLGENTPVYPFIYVHLPRMIRGALYSEYALMAFCFFAGITAAIVLDWFGSRAPRALLWCVALLTSYDLIHTGANRPMNSDDGSYGADLAFAEQVAVKLHALVNSTTPPTRIDYTDHRFWQPMQASGLLNLPTPSGNNPFALLRPMHVRWLYTAGNPWERDPVVNRFDSPLLNMMNVGFLVSDSAISANEIRRAGLKTQDNIGPFYVYRNPHVLPRFFLVPQIEKSSSETQTIQLLGEPSFNPAAEAIVEDIPESRGGLAISAVDVRSYTPNRFELMVSTAGPAFLVTSEPMYPGWTAKVNGTTQSLLMTNGAYRGLMLAPGQSDIVMEYHPRFFALSIAISSLALLAIAIPVLMKQRTFAYNSRG